jgi:hypothetical protein
MYGPFDRPSVRAIRTQIWLPIVDALRTFLVAPPAEVIEDLDRFTLSPSVLGWTGYGTRVNDGRCASSP